MANDDRRSRGLGSGLNGHPLCVQPCANSPCPKPATKFCKDCKLVGYCSKDCQRPHWQLHKLLCRSDLMKPSNEIGASWLQEGRLPSWLVTDPLAELEPTCAPLNEGLWGNVPAYGLLGSSSSCPSVWPSPLRLCFAASGDLRNVIETLCQLPDDFHGSLTVHVNDINPKVVVRNYLMLELLRIHGDEAIDAVIALWYSLALTPAQLQTAVAVAERVQDWPAEGDLHQWSGCFAPSDRPSDHCLVAKLHRRSLRLLKSLCNNSMQLSEAKRSRKKMMAARPDLVERRMGCLRPSHRAAWNRFRKTGVLLPLAIDQDKHMINQANRFLLMPHVGWALGDGASDPLNGWDPREVLAAGHGPVPPMDLYGCLFFYVREKLRNFILKWRRCNATIILTDMAAGDLAAELQSCSPLSSRRFHRIDTSNIADESYDGVKRVLKNWGPLLVEPSSSPIEPILITYFLNWGQVYNAMKLRQRYVDTGGVTTADLAKAHDKAFKRSGIADMGREMMMKGELDLYRYFHDFSGAFKEYLQMHGAQKAADEVGVQQRVQHVLVPHRLFVDVGASSHATPAEFCASPDDFYCTSGCFTLLEKFVEWGPCARKR